MSVMIHIFDKTIKFHLYIYIQKKWNVQSNNNENTYINITEPGHEKMCLMSYANNKGADQPAHPRSLISTFVVHCMDSILPLLALNEISRP